MDAYYLCCRPYMALVFVGTNTLVRFFLADPYREDGRRQEIVAHPSRSQKYRPLGSRTPIGLRAAWISSLGKLEASHFQPGDSSV